jgi:hypothetical protein
VATAPDGKSLFFIGALDPTPGTRDVVDILVQTDLAGHLIGFQRLIPTLKSQNPVSYDVPNRIKDIDVVFVH